MKKKKTADSVASSCPCGSGRPLAECCGRYHAGEPVPDAERLMRSRYSAYVLGLEAYLLDTWHASTRPSSLDLASDTALKWSGLTVLSASQEGDQGRVAFVARYKVNGRAASMREDSRFVFENHRWYYLDGLVHE